MRIAILIDRSRFDLLPNEEGFREDEQKRKTAESVREVISKHFECIILEADDTLPLKLSEEKVDFVFNLCNGIKGEGKLSQIPAFLEFVGIPYTGSSILGHALASNKIYTCKIIKSLGISTPDFFYVNSANQLDLHNVNFPVIVKPCDEGSSRGIYQDSLVYEMESLKAKVEENLKMYNPPVMVTEFIDGREFHVGILGNGDDMSLLPIEEICLDNLPDSMTRFYSFEVKAYYKDKTTYICPAPIGEELTAGITKIAKRTFNALSLRDYARLDLRIKDSIPYVLEINSLPGLMNGFSALTRMADACELGYDGLVMKILESAFKRYKIHTRLQSYMIV
jgi:D-alanine-D-alanine ligase